MLPIMLSARQGWSTGTYKQKSRLTYQIFGASHVAIEVIWTYVVASSKNPVELQVLVWPDKTLGAFAGATVQRLPRQAQEGLDPVPSEINESPNESFRVSQLLYILTTVIDYLQYAGKKDLQLTWASEPMLLLRWSSKLCRALDWENINQLQY